MLALVHRPVGLGHQRVEVVLLAGVAERDSECQADGQVRLRHGLGDYPLELRLVVGRQGLEVAADGEHVTGNAADHGVGCAGALKSGAGPADRLVAGLVAVFVVDLLDPVERGEDHARADPEVAVGGDPLAPPREEAAPVVETAEGIVEGEGVEGDVLERDGGCVGERLEGGDLRLARGVDAIPVGPDRADGSVERIGTMAMLLTNVVP